MLYANDLGTAKQVGETKKEMQPNVATASVRHQTFFIRCPNHPVKIKADLEAKRRAHIATYHHIKSRTYVTHAVESPNAGYHKQSGK